jgi:hypothetical protein
MLGDLGENRGVIIGAAIGLGKRIRDEEEQHDIEIARFQAAINELSEKLLQTQIQLASERCEIAGLRAFIKEVKSRDPSTPALAPSGNTYRNGKPKSIAATVYEKAYDTKADELGLPDLKGGYAA